MADRALVPIPTAGFIRRLLDRLAVSAARPSARSVQWDNVDDPGWSMTQGAFPTNYNRTGRNVRMLGWESHATVQACARTIAEAFAAVPWEAYSRAADGSPTVLPTTHPANLIVETPRRNMTGYNLRALLATHYKVYGNAFLVIERARPNGPPSTLRLIHPEWIQYVYLDRDTLEPAAYRWRDRWGSQHVSDVSDVVHFRDLSAYDWLFGYPAAAAALLEIASEREASEYIRHILNNDGTPGNVALAADGVTANEARTSERRWRERMVERGGRGGVVFLTGIKDFKAVGFNLKDLEFPELRALSREQICAAFNVDPRMIGAASATGSGSALSGAEWDQARRRLYSQAVIPLMRSFEAILDAELGAEFGFIYFRSRPEALADLTETLSERSLRVGTELEKGIITRQEARRSLHYPEEMTPTDTLVGSLQRLEYPVAEEGAKLDAATAPKPAPIIAPPAGAAGAGGKDPEAGDAGDAEDAADGGGQDVAGQDPQDAPGAKAAAAPPARRVETRPVRVLRRGTMLSPEARRGAWERFDTSATKLEAPYKRAAMLMFADERADLTGLIQHAATVTGRADSGPGWMDDPVVQKLLSLIQEFYASPTGKYYERWLASYRQLISETTSTAAVGLADKLGYDFHLESPAVQDAIQARAAALAQNVTDYSAGTITDLLSEASRQGMTLPETAALLGSTLDGMSDMRATRIARTETVGALNQGELLSATQSGIMSAKEWLTMGDDRVRDSHAAQDGEQVGLNDVFANGLAFPGDQSGDASEVVNCRCTLLYYD